MFLTGFEIYPRSIHYFPESLNEVFRFFFAHFMFTWFRRWFLMWMCQVLIGLILCYLISLRRINQTGNSLHDDKQCRHTHSEPKSRLVACTARVGHACLNLACVASQFHPDNLKNKGSWFMVPSRTLNMHGTLQSHMFFIVEKVSLDYEVFFTLKKK